MISRFVKSKSTFSYITVNTVIAFTVVMKSGVVVMP